MSTGLLLLLGMAIFGVSVGIVGCFLGAAESAERKLRELGRHAREPWDAEHPGSASYHRIDISGPTPTG